MAPKCNLDHVSRSYPFMTCIVKVNTQYSSYSKKTVAKVLEKCHGVYNFRMDDNGVVEISGIVNPSLLLKILGRAGKSAELRWLQFGECSSNLFVSTNNLGSRDGRYLRASNLYRPTLPSQTSNQNYGYDRSHHCYSRSNQFAFHQQQQHYDRTYNKFYESGSGDWMRSGRGCCTVM